MLSYDPTNRLLKYFFLIVAGNHVCFCLCLLSSHSQLEKHLSNNLVEPIDLNVIVKRRLNFEKSDLPLIGVEGNLESLKVGKNTCNCVIVASLN